MIRYHGEYRIEFLHILNAIQTWQVPQQYLVNDVVPDKLSRIFPYLVREHHFGITAIIDVINKELVQALDINCLIIFCGIAVPLHQFRDKQLLIFLQMNIFIESKRRKQVKVVKCIMKTAYHTGQCVVVLKRQRSYRRVR